MVNILLLRGLVRERRHWMGFDEILLQKIQGGRVHCLDLPGMGTEYGRNSPSSVEGILEDLRNRWLELQKQHANEPWVLVSISLGSMVALRWVECFETDFKGLVVINTSAANLSAPYKRFNLKIIPPILTMLGTRKVEEREALILKFTTSVHKNIAKTAQKWASWSREQPLRFGVLINQLWAAIGFRAPSKIEVPLLCLVSEHDSLTNSSCTKVLAARLKAPMEIHLSGGHDLALDDPDWVASKVHAFVENLNLG